MKKLMQRFDKGTYLRAGKTRFGCGICSRISKIIQNTKQVKAANNETS